MTLDRRTFVKAGAATAVAALTNALKGLPALAADDAVEFARHFAELGYKMVDPVNLIQPHEYNGGLLYTCLDGYHKQDRSKEPDKWFVMQGCGRLEDVEVKHEPAVLAHFHIISFRNIKPAYPGEILDLALEYLIRKAEFKPERMIFVSTEKFRPFVKQLEPFGITGKQVVYRSIDEAMQARDGSGYFSPAGHPADPGNYCASFHYVPEGKPIPKSVGYPPEGYIEIGEFLFESAKKPHVKVDALSFGVERLAMARGKPAGDFESSRKQLVAKLEAEAKRRGVDLPDAHGKYSEL